MAEEEDDVVHPLEYKDDDSDFGENDGTASVFAYSGRSNPLYTRTASGFEEEDSERLQSELATAMQEATALAQEDPLVKRMGSLTVHGENFQLAAGKFHPSYEAVYAKRRALLLPIVDPSNPPLTTPILNYDVWETIIQFLCVEDARYPNEACEDQRAFIALAQTCRSLRYHIDSLSTWFNLFVMTRFLKNALTVTPKARTIGDKWYSAVMCLDLAAMAHLVNKGIPAVPLVTPSGYLMETYTHILSRSRPVNLIRGRAGKTSTWFLVLNKHAKAYHAGRYHKGSMTIADIGEILCSGEGENPKPEDAPRMAACLPPNYVDHLVRSFDFAVACGMVDPERDAIVTRAVERSDHAWNESMRRQYLTEIVDNRKMDVNKGTLGCGWTPLHEAVSETCAWVCEFLLERGANPHARLFRSFDSVFERGVSPRDGLEKKHRTNPTEETGKAVAVFRKFGIDIA